MDRKTFFDVLRPHVALTAPNVDGMTRVLSYALTHRTARDRLAYILATALWETNFTMQPVEEAYWLSDDWRRRNLRYYPFYGRGLVQITWAENYRKAAQLLGRPRETFIRDPGLVLEWDTALPLLFAGMETGLYTGKRLDDVLDGIDEPDSEDFREYVAARAVVNGTDKAARIAALAIAFETALKAAGYAPGESKGETDPVLRRGASGDAVKALQSLLNENGRALAVDGAFGPLTEAALIVWQTSVVGKPGVAEPQTWSALRAHPSETRP